MIMTSTTLHLLLHLLALLLSLPVCTLALSLPIYSSSFPSITTYTALGDSYASGNGAGNVTHPLCGQFSSAYPIQLAKSIGPVRFHSVACGGASTASVIWDQFRWIRDSDLVTLTVGGNEVDFFAVLNECVYRWWPGGTCDAELKRSRDLIERRDFVDRFASMVTTGVERVGLGGDGRFLVTGYATFFNDETIACDEVSFGQGKSRPLLTRHLRRDLNQLVRLLNHIIRGAAEAAGAEYVDIDQVFDGHRFCEDGVSEPNAGREDTWFFNLQYHDTGTDVAVEELLYHDFPQNVPSDVWPVGFVGFTRVFHPTEHGHGGIRDAIVKHLRDRRVLGY